jgi:pimeloyl-ACP methyl ester carboxylesterase
MDSAVFGVGAPNMPRLLAETRARVILARGEHDPMVTDDQLTRLQATRITIPGLGHNAHVEDPAAVAALLNPSSPRRSRRRGSGDRGTAITGTARCRSSPRPERQ